jgi:hypothetical protein
MEDKTKCILFGVGAPVFAAAGLYLTHITGDPLVGVLGLWAMFGSGGLSMYYEKPEQDIKNEPLEVIALQE